MDNLNRRVLLGPLSRFVVKFGNDTQAKLRQAMVTALDTPLTEAQFIVKLDQVVDDLSSFFHIEGSIQTCGDSVIVRVHLCDMRGVMAQAWKQSIPRTRFNQDSATFADSVVVWIDCYVGHQMEVWTC